MGALGKYWFGVVPLLNVADERWISVGTQLPHAGLPSYVRTLSAHHITELKPVGVLYCIDQ